MMSLGTFRLRSGFSTRLLILLTAFSAATVFAGAPPCLDKGKALPIDNMQAIEWKKSTQSGFKARSHVEGRVTKALPDATGHDHYLISIGESKDQVLEVIYNQEFGDTPEMQPGMLVEACGDFIQANKKNGPYPPSPAGAIIHWVHISPDLKKHETGYLVIDGVLYGQSFPKGEGRRH